MTFADTDLDMNIQAKSWIAILLAASQLINIGITAASLPPGTYVHAVESIPWLYLLIRFNKITNGEPDYLRFTELWTISFVGIDISWAIYYFYLATVSETGHFFGMGVTDLLAAAAIALAYHSQKRRGGSATACCYTAIYAYLISWGVSYLVYDLAWMVREDPAYLQQHPTKWALPAIFIVPTVVVVLTYWCFDISLAPTHVTSLEELDEIEARRTPRRAWEQGRHQGRPWLAWASVQ